jgi:membrane protein DedA with SNARE-associated domain
MSAQAIVPVVCLAVIVGAAVGYFCGRAEGIAHGRAEQWVEDYFAKVQRERARRDKIGRFKPKGTT